MEDKNKYTENNLSEILDKMLKLQQGQKRPSFLKKTVYVSASICVIVFVVLICVCIYKNSFTIESIFATLLAFFSIFISIFFYFKTDETSNRFYDSSYKFMKDISVTLGKIEERFGEKLNSLNDKVSHLDRISSETSKEIEDKQDDKDSIINDLLNKANLNEGGKAEYKKQLEEKDAEIERLKRYKYRAEREALRLRDAMTNVQEEVESVELPSRYMLMRLAETEDASIFSPIGRRRLQKLGLIDMEGNVNLSAVLKMMDQVS